MTVRAIKDINFLPDYVLQRQVKAKRNVTIFAWVCVCLFAAGALYLAPIQIHKYYTAQKEDNLLKLKNLSEVQKQVNALEELRKNKDKKNTVRANINSKQVRIVENIDKINSLLPAGVKLKGCNISGKEFNSYFIVDTPLQVADLVDALEKSKVYKKVTLMSTPIKDENTTINIKLELK